MGGITLEHVGISSAFPPPLPFLSLTFLPFHHPLSLLGASTGADDVISSVQFDRQQLTTTWRRAVVFAVHTSPVKQFGIGFGIGWWVCSLELLYLFVPHIYLCFSARISGYLFKRVSRTAAFLVGCSFIALQVCVCVHMGACVHVCVCVISMYRELQHWGLWTLTGTV